MKTRSEDAALGQSDHFFAIDLDRVAIDCDERFAQAEKRHEKGSADYWRAALDPDQILLLDKPLPGAIERLALILQYGELCYVTSRSRDCSTATREFLRTNKYPFPERAICRPVKKGLTTVRFKRRTIRALSYGLSADFINRHFWLATNRITLFFLSLRRMRKILFVDDSEKNCKAIAELGHITVASLDEAIQLLNEGHTREK